jgi:hypothetical protein
VASSISEKRQMLALLPGALAILTAASRKLDPRGAHW